MRSAMFFCAALFASSGTALADETNVPATTGESKAVAGESSEPAPAPSTTPAPIPPPPALDPAPAPVVVAVPEGPEPVIGWGRGRRAPMYASLLLGAGLLGEDGDNRLTTRDSKTLEGVTGILRIGATLSEHSRLGARLQSFIRPTKKLLYDTPPADGKTDKWGVVSFAYAGPEYIYTTDFGLYAAGSLGLAVAASNRDIDDDDDDDDGDHDDIERGAGGLGAMISLGYEWRVSKWFAMNAELFGGGYSAIDDNDNSMMGGIFGFAMGGGF